MQHGMKKKVKMYIFGGIFQTFSFLKTDIEELN